MLGVVVLGSSILTTLHRDDLCFDFSQSVSDTVNHSTLIRRSLNLYGDSPPPKKKSKDPGYNLDMFTIQ